MMLSSPGALLRFSLFIDASTSDRSMDGASMLEVVVFTLFILMLEIRHFFLSGIKKY